MQGEKGRNVSLRGNKNAAKPGPDGVVVTVRLSKENRQAMNDYLAGRGVEPTEDNVRAEAREIFWNTFDLVVADRGRGIQTLTEEIAKFARQYADKGELTDEEVGYSKAMLMVARLVSSEYDDVTDALLDHIEASKIC